MFADNANECMFSGEVADTYEHVIPKWLQRRFDLWNQELVLPNGTSLPYRQVKVPVKGSDNNRFSTIEKSMAGGSFSAEQAYLWALKIHIGLIYRDATLRRVRAVSDSPMILNAGDFATEILLFRELYDIWKSGGRTDPSPFGSVYILDSLRGNREFDFFHCLVTGTVGVNLGDKFLVVFLWDQGDGSRSNSIDIWQRHHVPSVAKALPDDRLQAAYMAHHVWACESGYQLWRHRRPFNFIRVGNTLVLAPPLTRSQGKPLERDAYEKICRSFGLRLKVFNGEIDNVYLVSIPTLNRSRNES
jgi:hypothetical protein